MPKAAQRETPPTPQANRSKQKPHKTAAHPVATPPAPKHALSTETVRKNAASKFKECLELAVKEAKVPVGEGVDTLTTANAIEMECHRQTGVPQACNTFQ
jgi:hypothetical protein